MIEPLFIDTGGWIAVLSPIDDLHEKARQCLDEARRQKRLLVTTTAVLQETLDGFARHHSRHLSPLLRRAVDHSRVLETVPIDGSLLIRGWDLYESREDKNWGMTDCLSFVVMTDRGLHDALAYDHHFLQAGFRPLLRDA